MEIQRIENMCGGNGHVFLKPILNEKQLNGKCGLYAEVTLEPVSYTHLTLPTKA